MTGYRSVRGGGHLFHSSSSCCGEADCDGPAKLRSRELARTLGAVAAAAAASLADAASDMAEEKRRKRGGAAEEVPGSPLGDGSGDSVRRSGEASARWTKEGAPDGL